MAPEPAAEIGEVAFSPGAEEWIEYGPGHDRRRIDFHDYSSIYAMPGLYERVFYDALGMRSTREVVRLFGEVLEAQGLDPAAQRVLDFGAGNGLGGEALREVGVGELVGVDLEPMARTAAERDRPGTYDEYHVGDLGSWSDAELEALRERPPTALLVLSAIGHDHVPAPVLDRALALLGPGGLYAFAVNPAMAPGSDDAAGQATGYPEYIEGLLARSELLAERRYVHRIRPDGSDDPAVAFVGRLR
jgi:SAM-dependent methyltransferase